MRIGRVFGRRRSPADAHDHHGHDRHGCVLEGEHGIRLGVRGVGNASGGGAVVAVDTSVHVDDARVLRWFVMSEERLHVPATEPSLRVTSADGAPVVTQRIALPGGDASLTSWMVADDGGTLVLEFVNESPRACAFIVDGPATRAGQQPQPVYAVPGVPASARSYSVGHRATLRLAVGRGTTDPGRLADADRVASGWVAASDAASSINIPATTYAAALVAARARIAVAHGHEWDDLLEVAPDLAVLGLAERTRMGESLDEWIAPVADAVARIGRTLRTTQGPHGRAHRALQQAAFALRASNEERAALDAARLWARLATTAVAPVPPDPLAGHDLANPQRFNLVTAIDVAAGIEQRCVRAVSCDDAGGETIELFAHGFPASWRGVDGNVEGVCAGPRHTLSFAMRWHGERLAVLWESAGPAPVTIVAPRLDPTWSVTGTRGDALLAVSVTS